ncbi:cell division protein FtsL [Chthonobacter albigriseus]|uniref:cell division protein FtsL n=1 Tax=Chthonobacter albigriseus TaxID=1683161 RepID=UPI0015EF7561|nr:hypothetical protein [Chthonobacter albigriseus]
MTRFVNALLVFLMVLSAAAVYDMKYEAELASEKLARVQRQIAQEQERISFLKAEWSVLTQPARLEELVDRHTDILQLTPITANHIGTLADIPAKPVEVPPVDVPIDVAPHDKPAQSAAVEDPAITDDADIR